MNILDNAKFLFKYFSPSKTVKSSIEYKNEKVLSGLMGLCIGDALGLVAEFKSRDELKLNPIKDMIGYGTFSQPPGTWSDDSSLTFCLAESLCSGFDLEDISKKFCDWYYKGYWTPHGKAFDIGITTKKSIYKIHMGENPEYSGGVDEYSNGNGSLMRILPLAYYLQNYEDDKFEIIHKISSITHGHIRSKIACSIYIEIAMNLLKGYRPYEAYEKMKPIIINYYTSKGYNKELGNFNRILKGHIWKLRRNEIKSNGYVISTLEASLWCFLNTNSYSNAVLYAVNLGFDTDTTGAVTGGLAGIYYGIDCIPPKWIDKIAKKDDIVRLSTKFADSLYKIENSTLK